MFGILIAVVALIGGLAYRTRLHRMREVDNVLLTDDMVRQIEASGFVDVDDEPLDHDTIQEEEARFWEEEPWEEVDEW